MGKREDQFNKSLAAAGYEVLDVAVRKGEGTARTHDLPSTVRAEIVNLYRELGGVLDIQDFKSGKWDIVCKDGLTFEVDEDLHFNEYRAATFRGSWASQLPWRESYMNFSARFREKCLGAGGYGGKWQNPSTDKMFGGSDPAKTFTNLGSSRWKQRALYDSVKDAYAIYTSGASLVRISIHDEIDGVNVGLALNKGHTLNPDGLRTLIEQRTVHA